MAEARDRRIPLTVLAYLTILLLTNTYWKWLGLVL